MTTQRTFKRLVRERMASTGQRYASARRSLLREAEPQGGTAHATMTPGGGAPAGTAAAHGAVHLPGAQPDATALRVLLANAGVDVSEAMALGIAGGAGACAMAFRYKRDDVSSFFLTGWNVFQSDVRDACARLGVQPEMTETGGARTAQRQLRALLDEGVPAMAWVDLAVLGYAGLPAERAGGSYHRVVVYADDPEEGTATLGDRAPQPIDVPSTRLTEARTRIRKDRHRLLSLGADEVEVDLEGAVRAGLRRCAEGPPSPPTPATSLDGIRRWGERLAGTGAKDGWAAMFPPGRHLWGALREVYAGTVRDGGGLLRPAQAAFLREAAAVTGDERLLAVADRYAELGEGWTQLGLAALPADVPALRRTRELVATCELGFPRRGPAAEAEVRAAWEELDGIADEMDAGFPLDAAGTDALLADLQRRVLALHADEVAAREVLAEVVLA